MNTAAASQSIWIIIHARLMAYGCERCFLALRLVLTLAGQTSSVAKVQVFWMSDAVGLALPNQQDASVNPLQNLRQELQLCRCPSCDAALAR